MTRTIELKKLSDSPEYQACASKLTDLKATESDLKAAIRQTEEAMRADVDRVLPDEKKVARLKCQRENLVAIQRAITEQERAVANARMVASRSICEVHRREHDEAQRRMTLAILDANKAALSAADIREQLDRGDISTSSLHVAVFPELGMGSLDACSRLAYFTRDCLAHGLLDRNELPADWLKRWGL